MIYSILLNNISHLEKLHPLPSEKSTVKDLKDHLRKMDLKVSGVKTELWDRIKSEYGTKNCPILKKHQHIVKKRASYREYRVNRPDKPYKSIFDLHKEALLKYGGNIEAFKTEVYRQYQEDQRRIKEMKFFYNHTKYETIVDFIKRYEYNGRWYNRDLKTIKTRAKSRALKCWKKRNTNWKESNILPKSLHDGCGKKC
jgi:ABC-type bacteriocin/lantibiotic exporter with double-glycine peptidase domain